MMRAGDIYLVEIPLNNLDAVSVALIFQLRAIDITLARIKATSGYKFQTAAYRTDFS